MDGALTQDYLFAVIKFKLCMSAASIMHLDVNSTRMVVGGTVHGMYIQAH